MSLTEEKRVEFVFNIIPLALWYVRRRYNIEHGGFPGFRRCLTAQTPVYRLTELWDGRNHPASGWADERWEAMVQELYECLSEAPADFEEAGTSLLAPLLRSRIAVDLGAWPWTPCGYCPDKLPDENLFGPFAYEKTDQIGRPGEEFIAIHLGNIIVPRSPFEDMPQMCHDLLRLTECVMARHPAAVNIGCNSWLNSFARFLSLFPLEWGHTANLPGRVGCGYNWWGQFISRTGGFNFRNAKTMRATGAFPFQARNGRCGIKALQHHLLGLSDRRFIAFL
jgi:hypothetical protein